MKRTGLLTAMIMAATAAMGAASENALPLSVVATIPGPDGGWDFTSIDGAARRLYVAHGDAVMSVDLVSGKVTPKLVEGKHLHAVLPLGDGRVLSTSGGSDSATVFDGATGRVLASIPTGPDPDAAVIDPSSGLVLVMQGHAGNITLIDPKSATSPGQIPVGGALEFPVADGHGKAFVNIEDKGEIAVVDIAGRKVLTHYKLPGCEEPSGLALDLSTGVMVSACANNKAVALKAADGAIVAIVPIGGHPDAVIFDAKRKLFFVPCGEGSLVAISADAAGAKVTEIIPTAAGARTAALDDKTGRFYLPTADMTAPLPGEKHPKITPGTFRILVVGEK